MNTTTSYGTYGQRLTGANGTQVLIVDGRTFLVDYTFESWTDVLGTLEVLGVREVNDEFGMGVLSTERVTDPWWTQHVTEVFTKTMVQAVRTAMGVM